MEELNDMASKNEEKWLLNYEALKAYIEEHHHLPDKHSPENRGLLNWVKYQRKRMKAELMPEEQKRMLDALLDSRSTEHTGGRKKVDSSSNDLLLDL